MFTGIVETMGTVREVKPFDASESGGKGYAVTVGDATAVLADCAVGDSISTNGVCLTVTEFDTSSFKVGIAPETLSRSNLGELRKGDKVNLERAVTGATRLGGHVVQGHVDTVATIVAIVPDSNTLRMTFQPRDLDVMKYIVEKGFVALDGASLTVTAVTPTTFSVMLIAHTQRAITLGAKKVGDRINVEVDLTGKLIEKQVAHQVAQIVGSPTTSLLATGLVSAVTAAAVVLGFQHFRR